MAMRGSFAADEAGAERANPQRVQSSRRRGLNHGMGREPQIIVIGKTDAAPAIYLGFLPQSVDRREERVTAVEVGFSGEPEALCCVFGEAIELLHFAFGGPAEFTKRKSGVLAAASRVPLLGGPGSHRSDRSESWHSISAEGNKRGSSHKPERPLPRPVWK